MHAVYQLSDMVGTKRACESFQVPRSSFYRAMQPAKPIAPKRNAMALTKEEINRVLDVLHQEDFMDKTPYKIYASLLDQETYLCSIRTMYRLLQSRNESIERRRGHQRIQYEKPELLACKPNEIWSWDITKLKTDTKWSYYYLYVIMDIYSRYVTGWMLAERETAELASDFLEQTIEKYAIAPNQLTIHSDRGASMKSKTVAQLLTDLNVMKSHSRPNISNDNPYSEAQFKTLKYQPQFPKHFVSLQEARAFCVAFFNWYNHEHYHTGIALLTPHSLFAKKQKHVIEKKNKTLEKAFLKNPLRFKNKKPKHPEPPKQTWINKPNHKDLNT